MRAEFYIWNLEFIWNIWELKPICTAQHDSVAGGESDGQPPAPLQPLHHRDEEDAQRGPQVQQELEV